MLLRVLSCLLLVCVSAHADDSTLIDLQALIDDTPEDGTLMLEPGRYAGPVIIDKPMTLDGDNQAIIDAGGKGTVVLIDTDGATVRKLHLTNSGNSHNELDAGIQVRGNFNVISDNRIDDCLFGVDLQQSEFNVVRRNHISSKDVSLGIRGDAIRLWYSFDNRVEDNRIEDSRDIVVWYSRNNTIKGNHATRGRYSVHFMYSQYNLVEDNDFRGNSVGIFLMYSDGVVVRNNHISHAVGAAGVGIGFKETSDVLIEGNEILYCALGMHIDVSPYQPDTTNQIKNNLVAYNGIGVQFLNDWTGNIFEGNNFKGNLTQAAVLGGKTANRNVWQGNYWDDYQGFDRDGDGIGDTPHEQFAYADRIWMDVPQARFFKGAPMLEVIDFLERLAPFTSPDLLLRDTQPLMKAADVLAITATDEAVATETNDENGKASDEPPDAYERLKRSLGRE